MCERACGGAVQAVARTSWTTAFRATFRAVYPLRNVLTRCPVPKPCSGPVSGLAGARQWPWYPRPACQRRARPRRSSSIPPISRGSTAAPSTRCARCTRSAWRSRPSSRTCGGWPRPASTSSRPRSTAGPPAARSATSSPRCPRSSPTTRPRAAPVASRLPRHLAPDLDEDLRQRARAPHRRTRTLANLPTLSDDELDERSSSCGSSSARSRAGAAACTTVIDRSRRTSPSATRSGTPDGRRRPDARRGRAAAPRPRRVHPGPAPQRPAVAAQAERARRDLEPVPEPDRAGPAQAERRDPPADRQGAAHLGRDALRAGRDPRPARRRRRTSSGRSARTRPSPSARSRRCSRSTGRSSASRSSPGGRRRRVRTPADRAARDPPTVGITARCRSAVVAMLSVHTSPLAQPGTGDGGGMNVYVRSLASALAAAGVECDVLTRAEHPGQPPVVEVEPGVPRRAPRRRSAAPGAEGRRCRRSSTTSRSPPATGSSDVGDVDALHANYWISGARRAPAQARARPPAGRDVPHAGPRQGGGGRRRRPARAGPGRGGDRPLRGPPRRVHDRRARAARRRPTAPTPTASRSIPAGVDHERVLARRPGQPARRRLGLADRPTLLFVGRIQPLKGADLAVPMPRRARRPAAQLARRRAVRAAPTAPPSSRGCTTLARRARARRPGPLRRRPSRTSRLAAYYRAADVVLVPVSHRVVRARRARGRRVRHAGRRGRRRWAAIARRRRPHRVPRRRPRPARLRGARRRAAARPAPRPRRWVRAPRRARVATRGASPRRGCAGSTPTCPRASSSSARRRRPRRAARRARTTSSPRTSRARSRPSRTSRPSSTTRSCGAGTCASVATAATRRRSTSTSTSARCATRCTSCPTRRRNHLELYRFLLQRNHTMYGARFSIGPDGDVYLIGRVALEHLTDARSSTASSACSTSWSSGGSSPWCASPSASERPPAGRGCRARSGPDLRRTSDCVRLSRSAPTRPVRGPEVQEGRSVRGSAGAIRWFLGPRSSRVRAEPGRFAGAVLCAGSARTFARGYARRPCCDAVTLAP